jgi:hypothetical protein
MNSSRETWTSFFFPLRRGHLENLIEKSWWHRTRGLKLMVFRQHLHGGNIRSFPDGGPSQWCSLPRVVHRQELACYVATRVQ